MNRGFYTAATAMLIQQRRLNTVSNNLANIKTHGFRREEVVVSTFEETLRYRIESNQKTPIGTSAKISAVDEIIHFFDQANVEETLRNLDVAIMGEGFFEIEKNGQTLLTRNGHFSIDQEGYLVLGDVGRVLGQNGPIEVNNDRFRVNEFGMVFDEGGNYLDSLSIVSTEDYGQLSKQPNGLYMSNQPMTQMNAVVMQGSLEGSNVDMTDELTRMMEIQRNFQSVANALKLIDRLNERAANEIGKV